MEPENGDALGVEDLREALELEGWMRKHHRPSMAQRLPGSSLQTKVYQSEGVSATGAFLGMCGKGCAISKAAASQHQCPSFSRD